MISRRRLTLQLTPLLDMLLIVVFLQYFQLRDREQTVIGERELLVSERQALAEERTTTQTEIAELLVRMRSLQNQLTQSEQLSTEARESAIRDRQSLVRSQSSLELVLDQQKAVAALVQELFQIPPDEVRQLLNSARGPGDVRTPAERERLVERFRQLSEQSPGKMLEHLLSYEEIRKRCDVWNLHIAADGVATISDGLRTRRIRIPVLDDGEVLTEQFINELFTWYRTLPQPKSLVVILLTYDRDARIYLTESIRSALPVWVSRMQADSAGRSRFEYADLGFRIE